MKANNGNAASRSASGSIQRPTCVPTKLLGPIEEAAGTVENLLESLRGSITRAENTFEPVLREASDLPPVNSEAPHSPVHARLLAFQDQLRAAIARMDVLCDRSTL